MKSDIQSINTLQPANDAITALPMFLLVILSLGTFIIFFRGFMVAPILPGLATLFHVSVRHVSGHV